MFESSFSPFVPNAPFLYLLKTSEKLTVFWCFQGVEKGCIGNEWVKVFMKSLWVKVFMKSLWYRKEAGKEYTLF